MGTSQNAAEEVGQFQLPFKSMEEAVEGVAKSFGMSICENSGKVEIGQPTHNLLLSGSFMGKQPAVVRAIVGFNSQYGCVLKAIVRS